VPSGPILVAAGARFRIGLHGDSFSDGWAAGLEVDVSVPPLSQVPRALAARDTPGFVKLLRARARIDW